jgi:hypothetical protein
MALSGPESNLVHDIHGYLMGSSENNLIGAGLNGILHKEMLGRIL